jgi:Dolichyl-phosphate-mannose-protein mannosyltransferase
MQTDNEYSSDVPNWRARGVALALILAAAALRIYYFGWVGSLDLSPDEAHYWDWSRHLDWSYYSKGPGVAYLIHASCWLFGAWSEGWTGNLMLAVRLPAIACGSLLLVSLYILTVQVFRRETLALAVVVLGLTMPIFALGSSLMTIDSPYCCCWGWALVAGYHAISRRSMAAWVLAGLLVGLGILAKYTMVLWLPSLALFLLISREHRALLLRPGPWIACGLAALCCVPILIWNMQHDWVTLRHVGGQAGFVKDRGILWGGPLQYIGLQAAVLLGFWFAAWVVALVQYRPWRTTDAGMRYLWCMSVPMFTVFLLFSLRTNCEPNWPVTAYLSGLVLTAQWLAGVVVGPNQSMRILARTAVTSACVMGLGTIYLMHHSESVHPLLAKFVGEPSVQHPVPLRKIDPTCRLQGWRLLGAEVDKLRAKLRAEGHEPILAAASWTLPGELGLYCQGHPQVYCLGIVQGDRHSEYDFWHPNPIDEWPDFREETFIFVGEMTEALKTAFDVVEPPHTVTYYVDGRPIASWSIMVGRSYRGVWHLWPMLGFAPF